MMFFVITTPSMAFLIDHVNKKRLFFNSVIKFILSILFINLIFTCYYSLFNNFYRSINKIYTEENMNDYTRLFDGKIFRYLEKLPEIIFFHKDNSFPEAVLHYHLPDRNWSSKLIMDQTKPNLLANRFLRITEKDYNLSPKFFTIEIPELKEGYFAFLGEGFGYQFFINNISQNKDFSDFKKLFLFRIYPIENANANANHQILIHIEEYPKFKNLDKFETQISVNLHDNKNETIQEWAAIMKQKLLIPKNSKDLIIKMRDKTTNKIYENKYPI